MACCNSECLYLAKLLGMFGPQCSSTSFCFWHFNCFYSSVTNESFVDETRICGKYKISNLVSIKSLSVPYTLISKWQCTFYRPSKRTTFTKGIYFLYLLLICFLPDHACNICHWTSHNQSYHGVPSISNGYHKILRNITEKRHKVRTF